MGDINTLEYVVPTEEQRKQMEEVREKFIELQTLIKKLNPGRCRAIALTELETCNMWYNKAVIFENN